MNQIPLWLLKERQAYSLEQKIELTQAKIEEWYKHWDGLVYVAFSGGKDSTALQHLVREVYPDIPSVFNDTGLEYPEIRAFVKAFDNVVWLRPKMNFKQVIEKYGYPVISKETSQKLHEIRVTKSKRLLHKRLHGDNNKYRSGKLAEKWKFLIDAPFKISHRCCDVLKKNPAKKYERETGRFPILGTMTVDSQFRRQSYVKYGCNAYELGRPRSCPMSFWTTDDVWEYIEKNNLQYASVYDVGIKGTGCIFCAFGAHRDKVNKFQHLRTTHPKLWSYCMEKLDMKEVLEYIGVPTGE